MKLELVTWNITGIRALMQSNPAVMSRDESTGVGTRTKKNRKAFDEAEAQLYQTDDGKFYHPAIAFWRSLFIVCPNRKLGGNAAASVVSMAVSSVEEEMLLVDPATFGKKSPKLLTPKDWVVDQRRVVNKKAGALIAARPKWPRWGGLLTLEIDREVLTILDPLTELMNMAGRYGVGVGRLKKVSPTSSEWGGLNLGKYSAELR